MFWQRTRAMLEQALTELAETRQSLENERFRRIAAEALAEERRQQVDKAYEFATRSEIARDEAIKARLASLDLVNVKLMEGMTEKPPPNMANFHAVAKQRVQAAGQLRKADRLFIQDVLNSRKKKAEATETKTA